MFSLNTHLKIATVLVQIFYTRFRLGKFRFGWYPFLGVTPGVGDLVSFLLAVYTLWIGSKMKLPGDKKRQMIKNIALDLVVGIFPVLGDIFDTVYKAHVKNLNILNQHSKLYIKDEVIEGEIVK